MTDKENKSGESIELPQEFIVLAVPASTLEIKIEAKVWANGEVTDVYRTMPYEEVREAIEEARTSYIPSDTVFTLTEEGQRMVRDLLDRAKKNAEEEE